MAKSYQRPEFETLNDVEEDIITASPEKGDNDVEDPWGDLDQEF